MIDRLFVDFGQHSLITLHLQHQLLMLTTQLDLPFTRRPDVFHQRFAQLLKLSRLLALALKFLSQYLTVAHII